jgi:hypothetical protein
MDVPLTRSFYILDNQFKGIKVKRSNSIECHIKQNQGPLEEGISGICLKYS